jgi:aminoglycoside 6'-N-acetyltransferase I
VTIKEVPLKDKAEYLRMRQALFGDGDHEGELEHFFQQPTWTTFVAEHDSYKNTGQLCGFIEVGQRPYAEGCETSPVAYFEGWYVDPDMQQQGVGRRLVQTAEAWAKNNGFAEIASDALLENQRSIEAHKALGYNEIERIVCFAKKLK